MVAIKIIVPRKDSSQCDDNETLKRERIKFEEEANLMHSLSHANIVKASLWGLMDVLLKIRLESCSKDYANKH